MVFVPDTRYRKIWVIMVDLYLIYKTIESMLRKLILEPKAFLVSTIFIFSAIAPQSTCWFKEFRKFEIS